MSTPAAPITNSVSQKLRNGYCPAVVRAGVPFR
jgi:hypothetical protein